MNTNKDEPKELYQSIIDQYFINGFNGVQAVRTVKGQGYNYNSAASLFNTVIKHTSTKAYIQSKSAELKRSTYIQNENILRELIYYAYSDITDYIGLTNEELKDLPPDTRRCIQTVVSKKKRYTNRLGEDVEEETMTVKLIDKIKAIDMIAKHIGFYEIDNKQNKTKINIERLNIDTLNALLLAVNNNN